MINARRTIPAAQSSRLSGLALVGVALGALLLAVAAAGKGVAFSRTSLALMPLPQRALRLGSEASGLTLAYDSGVVTNGEAAANANGPTTGAKLGALGRVTGYQLDFGGDAPNGERLSQVETGVELYQTPAAAAQGLAFWRTDALEYRPGEGDGHLAFAFTLRRARARACEFR